MAMNLDQSADKITPSTATLTVAGRVTATNIATTGTVLCSTTAPATNPATGTPSSTTYLRGDGTWAAVAGGSNVVLQVVTANDAGSSTTSTTAVNLNAAAISITPLSTSSKLVIQVSFQGIITAAGIGTNSYGYFQINEGATLRSYATINMSVVSGAGTNVQVSNGLCLIASVTNSALTARSFSIYGYSSTSSATCYANSMTWTITEVAI
jgi:hypothetical protein